VSVLVSHEESLMLPHGPLAWGSASKLPSRMLAVGVAWGQQQSEGTFECSQKPAVVKYGAKPVVLLGLGNGLKVIFLARERIAAVCPAILIM
jgi:hypothetical protein